MSKIKKIMLTVLLFLLTFSAMVASNGLAKVPKSTSYTYKINANHENTRSANSKYRNTSDTNNKWGVALTSSSEKAERSITRFWLERYDGTNVSSALNVRIGEGVYVNSTYSSASFSSVYLTAENNNYNNSTYNVSGKWRPYGY